jgi:hypothetical protein
MSDCFGATLPIKYLGSWSPEALKAQDQVRNRPCKVCTPPVYVPTESREHLSWDFECNNGPLCEDDSHFSITHHNMWVPNPLEAFDYDLQSDEVVDINTYRPVSPIPKDEDAR